MELQSFFQAKTSAKKELVNCAPDVVLQGDHATPLLIEYVL